MPYFVFNSTSNNELYKIAKDTNDLNAINGINQEFYLKILCPENDFEAVRLGQKIVNPYNGSTFEFTECAYNYTRKTLALQIQYLVNNINLFLQNCPQNPKFQVWLDYRNYLQNLSVNAIIPTEQGILTTSLEQYIESQGQTCYSLFQIP